MVVFVSLLATLKGSPSQQETEGLEGLDQDYGVESPPYILTNESNLQQTYETLSKIPQVMGGVHRGFSGWFNYDIAVIRGSSAIILNDINTPAVEVHKITGEAIKEAKNRAAFVQIVLKRFSENPKRYFREGSSPKEIEGELFRPGSWLNTDKGFRKIQSLFGENRVVIFRKDIRDRDASKAIDQWMQRNSLSADTCYISNIPDWFRDNDEGERNLRLVRANLRILKPNLVVDSSAYDDSEDSAGMTQRVYRPEDFDPRHASVKKI